MNRFNDLSIAILVSVCICYIIHETEAGGKGKGRQGHIIIQNEVKGQQVPIYMPIPIPIPMPVGPAGGIKHPHPPIHQQIEHGSDGEGEVKKIYLLQPVQKFQPQPQLKGGGFMGPIQNHIHVQTPIHSRKSREHPSPIRQQQHPVDGDLGIGGGNSPSQYQESDSYGGRSGGKGHSDFKILPIVVIPPIAPMPPIQLPQAPAQPPKMTLSPQFNNYVVAGSERRKSHSQSTPIGPRRDYKSFADYGGSLGGVMFKSSYGSARARPRGMHPRSPKGQDYGTVTWARSNSRGDDLSDFDFGPSSFTGIAAGKHPSLRGPHRRFAAHRRMQPYRDESRRSDSRAISDIIDRQIAFDDEPIVGASNEIKDEIGHADQHSDERKSSRYPNFDDYHHLSRESQAEQRRKFDFLDGKDIIDDPTDGNYITKPSRFAFEEPAMSVSDDPRPETGRDHSRSHHLDLNQMHYDRDSESYRPRARLYSSGDGRHRSSVEREIFEDDEWQFDSIKSVSHVSPIAGATNSTSTNSNSTVATLTTTIPPSLAIA